MGRRLVVPACRRHPGRRNTGLRTAPTAYRGWKLPRLWSAFPLWRSSSDGISSLVQRIYLIYCKKCALLRDGAGHCDTSSVKRSPHVATTPRGEIRGYARLPQLRGGGNARLRSSSPPLAEMRTLRMLVTWSGAHFKNRNKNTISSSEVTASLRMYPGALPLAEQGIFFAVNQVNALHRAWDAIAATPP